MKCLNHGGRSWQPTSCPPDFIPQSVSVSASPPVCYIPAHQARSHGGLCGAKPPKIKIAPQIFTDNNDLRSVQIGMLVLCLWYFRLKPWNAIRCKERAPIFQNILGEDPQTPAKARAFRASRWPATILAPPKSSIAPKILDLATGPLQACPSPI